MRKQLVLAALLSSISSMAFAQAGGIPLDEQLRRMRERNAGGTPVEVTKPATDTRKTFQPTATVESGSAPVVTSGGQPITTSAGLPISGKGEVINSEGNGAIPSLPIELVSAGDVSYLSGGIGDEENDQLKAQENNFNLRILITSSDGAFSGGVTLRIVSSGGKEVLAVDNAGPKVYVKLPAGSYKLLTTGSGGTQTTEVKVPASGAAKPHIYVAHN
jgi:hypothetical protein